MKQSLLLRAVPLLLAAALCGCVSSGAETAAPELLEPVDFRLDSAVASYQDIVSASYYDGALVPEWEELFFPVDGLLASVELYTGREVKAGELLAELDKENVLEEIESLEEEIAFLKEQGIYRREQTLISQEIARTELAQLRENRDALAAELRLKELSIEELETESRQAAELLELTLRQKESRIAVLQSQLANSRMTAPFDGQVLAVMENVYAGVPISAYAPVAYLADVNSLTVETAYISEGALSSAERIFACIGDQTYDLTPQPMDAGAYLAAVAAGEAVTTRFTINAPDGGAQMGEYACVGVVGRTAKNVLAVPSNALYRDAEGSYVYRIENEQRLRSSVETGLTNGMLTEIQSGLKEGDVVYVKD